MSSTEEPATRRPRGRPRQPTGTREAILDAALRQFSKRGFRGASIRAIAGAAGVDTALVGHYFGTKQQLFAATITNRLRLPEHVYPALEGDPGDVGRRFTRAYLGLWEDPRLRPMLSAIVRSAVTESGDFTGMLADVQASLLRDDRITDHGYSPEGVQLAAAQLLGVAIGRYVVGLPPVAAMDLDALVDALAPGIQHHVTGNTGTTGARSE